MIIKLIKSLLRRCGVEVMRRDEKLRLDRAAAIGDMAAEATLDLLTLLSDIEFEDRCPFFVQVGANDGVKGDPISQVIRDRRWSGILIEPQPDTFERLRANCTRFNVMLENVAVGRQSGSLELFRLRASAGDQFRHDDLATCDYDRLVRAKAMFGFEGSIEKISVPVEPLSTILERHGCTRVDVLVIDTEGMDYEVLASLDMSRFTPTIIQCEYIHLGETELNQCLQLFSDNGYRFAVSYRDLIAYRSTRRIVANGVSELCVRSA